MLIYGVHTCEECGKENEWFYQVSQNSHSARFEVDSYPDGKIKALKARQISEKEYRLKYICPNCSNYSHFNYESDYKL